MSIFYLGGAPVMVPREAILPEMYEDRIFLPGTIHGGDYLIRVYLNDSVGDDEPEEMIIEYLTREDILESLRRDPNTDDKFYEELLSRAESFACYNTASDDFATVIQNWPSAVKMSNSELVSWAMHTYEPRKKRNRLVKFIYNMSGPETEQYGVLFPNNSICSLYDGREYDIGLYFITQMDVPWEDLRNDEIRMPLGDGYSIVAYRDGNPEQKELFIDLKDPEDTFYQSLAIIAEEYTYKGEDIAPLHGRYSVKVYSDPYREDWQREHLIGLRKE